MFANFMTIPMTIQRAGATADRYGNESIDWSSPTSISVLGWLDTNIRRMGENTEDRDLLESDGTAFLPAGTDIKGTDRIVVGAVTYQVYGIPSVIYRPGSGGHHIECRIKRAVG